MMNNVSRILVLHARSAYGRGPIQSSINLCKAMHGIGAHVKFFACKIATDIADVPAAVAIPRALSWLNVRRLEGWEKKRIQKMFLRNLRDGDVAWLYPTVELWVYEEVHSRGNPIVMEGVNSRMAYADKIMRTEYEFIGLPYTHGIAPKDIANEDRKLTLATHFFAPNPCVYEILTADGSPFKGKILPSRHGVWRPDDEKLAALRKAVPKRNQPVFLFCGSIDVRKGAHLLLRAWAKANLKAQLVLCGRISPEIQKVCAHELSLSSVKVLGYVSDVERQYVSSDVFVMPSLEEGGPKVTAEAAAYGLPLVVSRMGGTWFWENPKDVLRIDPHDTEGFASALRRIAEDPELRTHLGRRARTLSAEYDWHVIGRDRYEMLASEFPTLLS